MCPTTSRLSNYRVTLPFANQHTSNGLFRQAVLLFKEGVNMATTRLMPLHTSKGHTVGQAIRDIIDYTENPQKTDGGRLITSWQCDSRIADGRLLSRTPRESRYPCLTETRLPHHAPESRFPRRRAGAIRSQPPAFPVLL